VLGRQAKIGVYEFILGDEEARECSGYDVDDQIALGRHAKDQPQYGSQHPEGVQRMPDELPARQSAREVEVELIQKDGEPLHGQRQKQQVFHGWNLAHTESVAGGRRPGSVVFKSHWCCETAGRPFFVGIVNFDCRLMSAVCGTGTRGN